MLIFGKTCELGVSNNWGYPKLGVESNLGVEYVPGYHSCLKTLDLDVTSVETYWAGQISKHRYVIRERSRRLVLCII